MQEIYVEDVRKLTSFEKQSVIRHINKERRRLNRMARKKRR